MGRNRQVVQVMTTDSKIDLAYEKSGGVGIYSLSGRLTAEQEDDLKIMLMKALYCTERAVINLKDITTIDHSCLKLLRNAYCTSLRLKNPVIMTGIPQDYADRIFQCNEKQDRNFQLVSDDSSKFTEKDFRRY
jgi:anti-anti-sigma regulatory factor